MANEKKRVIKDFKITELSAVDRPAQEGAVSVILKRADDINNNEQLQKAIVDYNQSTDKDLSKAQHIARRARALGLELDILKQGGLISFKSAVDDDGGQILETNMTNTDTKTAVDAELQKSLDAAKAQVDSLTAELNVVKSIAALTELEKKHYDGLSVEDKEIFLALNKSDRDAEIAKATSEDPVIYKSLAGEEFRKSDDPRIVAMAKRADANETRYKEEFAKRQDAEFAKRAETELAYMPGTVETRAALLKAVDTIADQEVKKGVLDSLKAKNASMSKSFETVGHNFTKSVDGEDPQAKLDELAKAHQAKEGVDYYTAYDVVSKAHPDLLKRAIG